MYDENVRMYIESIGKVEKKPFMKIFNFIPPEVEEFDIFFDFLASTSNLQRNKILRIN